MFEMSVPDELTAYQEEDRLYNNAADQIGSSMGTYGLSSMLFALIFTLITRIFPSTEKWFT
jgi:maltose/moltooligosaccharide transporter